MTPADWFMVAAFTMITVGVGWVMRPMWRITYHYPTQRSHFLLLAGQVALAGSVPVVKLATWGGADWYPLVASVLVLFGGAVSALAQRRAIIATLRATNEPDRRSGE